MLSLSVLVLILRLCIRVGISMFDSFKVSRGAVENVIQSIVRVVFRIMDF